MEIYVLNVYRSDFLPFYATSLEAVFNGIKKHCLHFVEASADIVEAFEMIESDLDFCGIHDNDYFQVIKAPNSLD